MTIKSHNLYGEDGIAVYLDTYGDICESQDAAVRVVGHSCYPGIDLSEAQDRIARAYISVTSVAEEYGQ